MDDVYIDVVLLHPFDCEMEFFVAKKRSHNKCQINHKPMKQRTQSTEKVWMVFVLFISVQLSLLLIIRLGTPASQEQESLGCKGSLQTSRALLQSIQGGPIICDRSHETHEWCFLNRPTLLDPTTTTFYTRGVRAQTHNSSKPPKVEKTRPYPRKWEDFTMSLISEVSLSASSINKPCDVYHDAPALVFSISGYTGNFFHDFNDVIVPLYITINTLFPDQDVTLVITNFTNWWYSKYEALLREFSRHPIVNLDNQTVTHCFPSANVGLISHGPMTIDPSLLPDQRSFLDFRAFLDAAYSKCQASPPPPLKKGKPRLLFVSRRGDVGRVILNEDEVITEAKEAGFDVVIFQPTRYTYLCEAYKLINSSHGMLGVHGAALTHSLFLQPGSVFIQIVPLGTEWVADSYFKKSATELSFQYVEYKIRAEESSLADKYGLNHNIVRNPNAIIQGNWSAVDSIYLKGQDVKLEMNRFRHYLSIAYIKAMSLMNNSG